ncbi:MAG TPA: aminotransferase class III-fold pyridoxal phosphate-dependent enzyme [Armatimonadetes bacterium]|nr:aminotransferase class III-fold pyridoxal phosphate-dependent enzyme [Armatimonadota bacterium]
MAKQYHRSLELFEHAVSIIPGGSQTLSKRPQMFAHGAYPVYLTHGRGAHVWDVDGNEYIDFVMALGPINLGYAYPRVNDAIREQLERGIVMSLLHPLEVDVAELLIETIPCAEMVRFLKSGAEAMSACVRLARAYTGREIVVHCGYHGWHDTFAATANRIGVPRILRDLIRSFPYNDADALARIMRECGNNVACIAIEPRMPPEGDFLHRVRQIADEYGAVLVFDEIVTGFRLALNGSQGFHNVTPDLTAFAKGIANGMPLAAVVGRREIMKLAVDAVITTTYGGETLSLAAAKATILELKERNVFQHTWRLGEMLQRGLVNVARQAGLDAHAVGYPPIGAVEFRIEDKQLHYDAWTLFLQEMAERGVLLRRGGVNFICYSHTEEDIQRTIEAAREAFSIIADGITKGKIRALLRTKKMNFEQCPLPPLQR